MERVKFYALLMFGGVGSRFGWEKPKQFYPIDELSKKTLLEYVVERFVRFEVFDKIVVVSPFEYLSETKELLRIYSSVEITTGGDSREHSVWNGINYLKDVASDDDIIVIHDGARPLVEKSIIEKSIESAQKYGTGITVINAVDTVSYSEDGIKIDKMIPRTKVFLHQTPQTFKYGLIKSCMEKQIDKIHMFTDEASILIASGFEVYYVRGSRTNIKVTTIDDIALVKRYTENS
ncbi:IspD/TarI family cytidylyltransferase [Fervidobacterium sp.]